MRGCDVTRMVNPLKTLLNVYRLDRTEVLNCAIFGNDCADLVAVASLSPSRSRTYTLESCP